MSTLRIRPGREGDLIPLTDLYNHYVTRTPFTFDLEPLGYEERRDWLASFRLRGPHRLMVAEDAEGVLGYACSHRLRPKGAYDTSVETTIYVAPQRGGRGIGARLYAALFEALAGERVHRAYAGITLPNPASVALHRHFGFEELGTFHEVGRKFGRYWSVQWFEKRLE